MCHRMNNSKTNIGEAHTSYILSQSHSLAALRRIVNCAPQRFGNNLDRFQMEHIGHFPCALGNISLNCVGQSIHTGCCGQSLWHRCHHIRINNSNNRNIMGIYTNEFSLFLYICNNIVNGNLCCGTCCSRNCNNRHAGLLGGSNAL